MLDKVLVSIRLEKRRSCVDGKLWSLEAVVESVNNATTIVNSKYVSESRLTMVDTRDRVYRTREDIPGIRGGISR